MATPTAELTFSDYQERSHDTAIYPGADIRGDQTAIIYCALGLVNEAGEASGVVKKWLRDGLDDEAVQRAAFKELGDVLWYLSELAHHLGLSLADVANGNRAKLLDRQARGVLGGSGDNR